MPQKHLFETGQTNAQDNIKRRLTEQVLVESQPIRAIFVVTVAHVRNSTSRRVKYFLATGEAGVGGLQDITGKVANALGKEWRDTDGTFFVKGGNGSDAINCLSIALFDDHDAIPVYVL